MRPVATAIVSGGARGIGRCITRRFLELNYHVFILDIDEAELKHTVETHLSNYHESKHLSSAICDLTSAQSIQDSISAAISFFPTSRIDVLVNNGGIAHPIWRDGADMSDPSTLDQWNAYIATNLTAPFIVSQACLPYMKQSAEDSSHKNNSEAGPCIIHIGSFRAHQSDPNQEGYASSKAGQLGLMHSMAISLGKYGIRVNLVAPGRIRVGHECKEGDEKGTAWEELNLDQDVEDHATNRAGRPKDIADAVEYLVKAGFVTGQDLTVDGGALRKKN
ncbi:hypothetical protein BDZ85DRAFT_255788 [Elsinoe ampelina]|uniref:Short chain alcohol dehydrogenase n=1 Tax=Elsinoe ampelina TaxID=302913 RepID=A0A6A6GKL8_9PEZI|nr:hypothetical protein BDZ85DRAFT_255788 [Elsinoe ampelina]